MKEDGNIFEMEVSVPGFSKEDLEVSVSDDILTVKGERKGKIATEKNRYLLEEFAVSSFERRFRLSEGIGKEKVEAHYENGVLMITFIDVPVEEEKRYQKVAVN